MKKTKHARLFVGPMSKEIVDVVVDYTDSRNRTMGLIPSRRQIENTGGYVNNWTTDNFVNYVQEKTENVILVRDHGGPLQGENEDNGVDSLFSDTKSGMEILHIDPWKASSNLDEGIAKTLELIEKCATIRNDVLFEIGTEAAIFPYDPQELHKMLTVIKKALGPDFNKISHCVVQSGVKISGLSNVGNFNPSRLQEMVKIVHDFGLLTKEHNGDYLSQKDIKKRVNLGLDSINIAPEFGVMQTRLMMEIFSDKQMKDAYETCIEKGKYKKWIPEHLAASPPKDLVISVAGHYSFTSEPFKSSIEKIKEGLKRQAYERFDSIIGCWDEK